MANITPAANAVATWDGNVYLLADGDVMNGGVGAPDNLPHQALFNQTTYLKAKVDALVGAEPDMTAAVLKFALDQAALANSGVNALHKISQQQGIFTIRNTGVISGCGLTVNAASNRDFTCAAGVFFTGGRKYSKVADINSGNVPTNITAGTLYAYVYLTATGACEVTALVDSTVTSAIVPAGGVVLARLTVPAGNTDANLVGVTVTTSGYLRTESAYFPTQLDAAASVTITLPNIQPDANYTVHFDIESAATGAPVGLDQLVLTARNTNYFTVTLYSAADNVVVRYKLSRLNAVNSKNTLI